MTRTRYIFTREQHDFIVENRMKYRLRDLAAVMNERYGTDLINESRLKYFCESRKIEGPDTHFKKGNHPLHPFKPGHAPGPTCFKKGSIPANRLKVGSEKDNHGYVMVKVADPDVWKPKAVVEYERYHGVRVKNTEVIIFLDGNNRNFSRENLFLVTRRLLARVCFTGRLAGDCRDVKISGIMVERLKLAMADMERRRHEADEA